MPDRSAIGVVERPTRCFVAAVATLILTSCLLLGFRANAGPALQPPDQLNAPWRVLDAAPIASQGNPFIKTLAFSPDGLFLAAGGFDGVVRIWDTQTWRLVWRIREATMVNAVAFSRDDSLAVGAYASTGLKIWDIRAKRLLWKFDTGRRFVDSLIFSPDGYSLAMSCGGYVYLIDARTGNLRRRLGDRHGQAQDAIAFSPDGRSLLAGNDAKADLTRGASLWDVTTGRVIRRFTDARDNNSGIAYLAYSPNGDFVAGTAIFSKGDVISYFLTVWDANTAAIVSAVPAEQPMGPLTFAPDGRTLAFVDRPWGWWQDRVGLWDVAAKRWIAVFSTDPGTGGATGADALAFSPDGRILAGAALRRVLLWSTRDFVHRVAP